MAVWVPATLFLMMPPAGAPAKWQVIAQGLGSPASHVGNMVEFLAPGFCLPDCWPFGASLQIKDNTCSHALSLSPSLLFPFPLQLTLPYKYIF